MASAPSSTPRMPAPARREQLLDVTTELAVERGFHEVSIEAVARRAGITRVIVYRHFDNLQALLEAVIARETSHALAQVAETALTDLSHADPKELMLRSLDSYLCAVRDHPATWHLVLMPPEGAPGSLRQAIAEGRGRVLAQMARAVEPALLGRTPGDSELTAGILSAVADEYARLIITDPDRHPPERLLRHARWWLDQATFGIDPRKKRG